MTDTTPKDPTSPEETIEEQDPLEKKDQPEEEEDLEEAEDLDSEDEEEESEEEESEDEPEKEESEDDEPKDPAPPTPPQQKQEPDYKQKFSSSTRRNQIVEAQLRELQKVLGDITKQEIPSDEEMTDIDPDWAYRSDFEKNLLIKQTILDRRQNQILHTFGNITKESERADELAEFIATKPELKGKEDEFYNFANDPKNAGAPMGTLLGAFLFEIKDETPAPTPKPEIKEKPPALNRATPTGGIAPKKDGETYSDEEIKVMRTKNPKLYHKLIRLGKI